jgi:hypothetical protein
MEAENYLTGGYGIRLSMESRPNGWIRLGQLANVWQPSRLKGVHVSKDFGTPFLAATQIFDLRPVPRKFLSLDRTSGSADRFVKSGMILVTRSGNVGRTIVAHQPHENILISDDLLRVEPKQDKLWGWIYAYLRAPQTRAMMSTAKYGHVIKHLEVAHLNALPCPLVHDEILNEFNVKVRLLVQKRDRTNALLMEAEKMFADAIGVIVPEKDPEAGFSVTSADLFGKRRRLEAAYHTTYASAILRRFSDAKFSVQPLSEVTNGVWWGSRFKRVFGDGGMPYMSADELFALNPTITKHVLIEQAENPDGYYVKAGWIMMACSGQIYGLNGSVALMTAKHERAFFSHDLVRIIPRLDTIRPGYLFMALGHPTLGRPLVIRYAYGTSIPHLDPADIATFPVVRLGEELEEAIANRTEEAIKLRAEADELENNLVADAEQLIDSFISGETNDIVMVNGMNVA